MTLYGLPHSDISGSLPACGSPKLFAANRVLRRLLAPRHPPYALSNLTIPGLAFSPLAASASSFCSVMYLFVHSLTSVVACLARNEKSCAAWRLPSRLWLLFASRLDSPKPVSFCMPPLPAGTKTYLSLFVSFLLCSTSSLCSFQRSVLKCLMFLFFISEATLMKPDQIWWR